MIQMLLVLIDIAWRGEKFEQFQNASQHRLASSYPSAKPYNYILDSRDSALTLFLARGLGLAASSLVPIRLPHNRIEY